MRLEQIDAAIPGVDNSRLYNTLGCRLIIQRAFGESQTCTDWPGSVDISVDAQTKTVKYNNLVMNLLIQFSIFLDFA